MVRTVSLYEETVRTYHFFVRRNIQRNGTYRFFVQRNGTYVPYLRTKKRYVCTVPSYKETVHTYRFFVQKRYVRTVSLRTVSLYKEMVTVRTYRFFAQRNGTYIPLPFHGTKKRYICTVSAYRFCVPFLLCTKKRYVQNVTVIIYLVCIYIHIRMYTYTQVRM